MPQRREKTITTSGYAKISSFNIIKTPKIFFFSSGK